MFNFGKVSTVNIVTRINQRNMSAIYQIVLKRGYKYNEIITTGISDHFPLFCSIRNNIKQENKIE